MQDSVASVARLQTRAAFVAHMVRCCLPVGCMAWPVSHCCCAVCVCFADLPELLKAANAYTSTMKMLRTMPHDVSVTTGLCCPVDVFGVTSRLTVQPASCSL